MIQYGSDTLIRIVGPTNTSTGTVIDQAAITAAGGSVTMKILDLRKQATLYPAKTYLHAEATAGTTMQIPKFSPAIFEAGDLIGWDDPTIGRERRSVISSVSTASSDYDELTVPAFANDLPAGLEIRLLRKGATSVNFPVLEGPDTNYMQIEVETITGSWVQEDVSEVYRTVATRAVDGVVQTAPDQDEYDVYILSGALGAVAEAGAKMRAPIADTGVSPITMTEYGTPVAGGEDWGFEGTIPDTAISGSSLHGLRRYTPVTVEYTIDAGAGLKLVGELNHDVSG